MVDFRPHVLRWVPSPESTIENATGYITPSTPSAAIEVPCRFYAGGTKEFKNQDNTVVKQIGRIRIAVGSEIPQVGQMVEVPGHFRGVIREIYKGQLTWRLTV